MPPEPSPRSPRPATARDGDTRHEFQSFHLPPLETRLFLGAIPWRLRQSLLHLLRCAACREALDAELATLESGPAQPSDRRYDQVFDRAEALGQGLAEERRAALGMLDEMFQRPVEEWPNFRLSTVWATHSPPRRNHGMKRSRPDQEERRRWRKQILLIEILPARGWSRLQLPKAAGPSLLSVAVRVRGQVYLDQRVFDQLVAALGFQAATVSG